MNCEFDTNGDGNCGRKTCARCHPEYQPLPRTAHEWPRHLGAAELAEYAYDPRCQCYLCMGQHYQWSRDRLQG